MEFAGLDDFDRRVYLTFCERFADIAALEVPDTPFVLFLGADSASESVDAAFDIAERMLALGAVYVMCWGPGAGRLEDLFDEAFVARTLDRDEPTRMTTSHEQETLDDALTFAVQLARPADEYAGRCSTMIVVLAQSIGWFNEAQNALEDLLH